MSVHNLEKLFRPASIAIIGEFRDANSSANLLGRNIQDGGFPGQVHRIEPSPHGFPASLPDNLDLALITSSGQMLLDNLGLCARSGVGGVVLYPDRNNGAGGHEFERELLRVVKSSCVRLIGPGSLGIFCHAGKMSALLHSRRVPPGRLAFISQSNGISSSILDLSSKEGIGFSYFADTGRLLDVDVGDLINFFGSDPSVSSLVIYLEQLTQCRKFMSAARSFSRVKPIFALKSGRSIPGSPVAFPTAGEPECGDDVYDAAFRRAGIVRVDTIEELFDCSEVVSGSPPPKGPATAVITNSRAAGMLAVDFLVGRGLQPARFKPETLGTFGDSCCRGVLEGNPVILDSFPEPGDWTETIGICLKSHDVDSLLVVLTPGFAIDPTLVATLVVESAKGARKPVFAVWMGGPQSEDGREILKRAGIPTFETPERAVISLDRLHSYARNLELLQEIPTGMQTDLLLDREMARQLIGRCLAEGKGRSLLVHEARELLACYGIAATKCIVVSDPKQAVEAAGQLGCPVSLKLDLGSTVGPVWGTADETVHDPLSAFAAYKRITGVSGSPAGVVIEKVAGCADLEVTVSIRHHPGFGPAIIFGTGGRTVSSCDCAVGLPPLNRALARRLVEATSAFGSMVMMGSLSALPLLEGVLIRVSQLASDFPEILELDIKPLILVDNEFLASSVRITAEPSRTKAPLHLSISPYPDQYEFRTKAGGGMDIFVRPIKPEDAALIVELFTVLSPATVYFRFFRPMLALSREMLVRFTQVDYDRDIVLVAIEETEHGDKMVGVARLMGDPDLTKAEFAVLVGDPWQGRGVGALLLQQCISIARARGLGMIWGMVLPENSGMIALGRKLGFDIRRGTETVDYELSLKLNPDVDQFGCPR